MHGKYCFSFLCVGDDLMPEYHEKKKVLQLSFRIPVLIFVSGISILKLSVSAISVSVSVISLLKAIDQPERECPAPARISCSPV